MVEFDIEWWLEDVGFVCDLFSEVFFGIGIEFVFWFLEVIGEYVEVLEGEYFIGLVSFNVRENECFFWMVYLFIY